MANENKVVRDYVFSLRTTKKMNEDVQRLSGIMSMMTGRRVSKAEAMEFAVEQTLKKMMDKQFAYAYEHENR